MRLVFAVVAAIAFASLVARSARVGLAGDYVDPVSRVTAQDEALYANTSIHMAREGGWLTPRFMGRYALDNPPLLYWLSAAAARCLGVFTLALRLPVAAIAALAAGLLFLWAAEMGGWAAGALCLALLVSNHLWHVLSGMALTEGLLAAFYIVAFYAVFFDPWLESKLGLWGFSGSTAAAILTQGFAGLLPLAALAVYRVAGPPRYRPCTRRVACAAVLAVALAAPWFAYQLAVHGKWLNDQTSPYGTGAAQSRAENPLEFYGIRLTLTDPMLLAAVVVAIPGLIAALRRREAGAVLLACWLAVTIATLLGWQYRNATYLLPMVPALALVAACYGPLASRASSKAVLGLALALVVSKAVTPGAPWGMSFEKGTVLALAPALQDYCERARPTELIIVGMDDGLYASALPLYRLRYALLGTAPAATGPFATVIRIPSESGIAETVRAHPESDFLLPDRFRTAADGAHLVVEALPAHVFLLSRMVERRAGPPAWTCRM